MVAGAGFEHCDLQIMTLTSYRTALPRNILFIKIRQAHKQRKEVNEKGGKRRFILLHVCFIVYLPVILGERKEADACEKNNSFTWRPL